MTPISPLRLWLRWVGANTLAEALGLGATLALDAAIILTLGEPATALAAIGTILLMTATGAVEGIVVGLLQWRVLQQPFPRLSRGSWLLATLLGALVAWFFGALPSTLMGLAAQSDASPSAEPPVATILLMAAAMGLFLGVVLGFPQSRALRQLVDASWLWIPANSVAWALGLPLVFAGVDLAQKTGSVWGAIVVLLASLAFTGATVGAVHGTVLVHLASRPKRNKAAA